ncbi:MAG: RsmF rRNA methyltransferase first C-terminal domain-containing protein [Thermotaleaceae bacterium]
MIKLPADFIKKMKALMGDEYDEFYQSYEEKKIPGLRINTLKIEIEDFQKISPFALERVPWCSEGFYYEEKDRPGKHPYHESGLYYIQEPSAMAVGTLIAPKPGEKILDLCAAPGGKSTHIAAKLQGEGILVSNEIHPMRAKILSQNIERMGIKNCMVLNEEPQQLVHRFKSYFDKILVDAPCSGEGMFRKDPLACEEWSLENVSTCAQRQKEILQYAGKMLKPEGRIIYSTCTFSPEENEGVIEAFLKKNKEFSLIKSDIFEGIESGKENWVTHSEYPLNHTIRLWPHRIKGEGHFIAVLKKNDGELPVKIKKKKKTIDKKSIQDYFDFAQNYLKQAQETDFILFGENLYVLPTEDIIMENLKIIRPGWHLGVIKKNRFEPSHALALSLKAEETTHTISFSADSQEISAYLKGISFEAAGDKGWNLICVDDYSIGWGKLVEGMLKNHYPKGLRW